MAGVAPGPFRRYNVVFQLWAEFNYNKWACLSFLGDPSSGLGLLTWLHTKIPTRIESRALPETTMVRANLFGSFQSSLIWKTQKEHFLPYWSRVNEYGACRTGRWALLPVVPTNLSDPPRSSFVFSWMEVIQRKPRCGQSFTAESVVDIHPSESIMNPSVLLLAF